MLKLALHRRSLQQNQYHKCQGIIRERGMADLHTGLYECKVCTKEKKEKINITPNLLVGKNVFFKVHCP